MTDNQETLIQAAALILVGALIAIALHDYTLSLQRQNAALMEINYILINENDNLRYCIPDKKGKAIITIVNDRPFCEIHTKL